MLIEIPKFVMNQDCHRNLKNGTAIERIWNLHSAIDIQRSYPQRWLHYLYKQLLLSFAAFNVFGKKHFQSILTK